MKRCSLSFLIMFILAIPLIAHAGYNIGNASGFVDRTAGRAGVQERDVGNIVADGLRGAIQLVGIFFLILMVYGGFMWMTARGNEDRITKARDTIIAAIIGIAVVVAAYAITVFVGRIAG